MKDLLIFVNRRQVASCAKRQKIGGFCWKTHGFKSNGNVAHRLQRPLARVPSRLLPLFRSAIPKSGAVNAIVTLNDSLSFKFDSYRL